LLILDAILSYFPDLRHQEWRMRIKNAADFACEPVRKRLPAHLPIDLSPLLVIFSIELLFFLW
jgi:uncharacterized protein YggT (Ycf19 family)